MYKQERGYEKKRARKSWITEEMINKMKERSGTTKTMKKEGKYIDRLTINYEEKPIKQELLIGIKSVRNWKIEMPKEELT